MRTLLLAFLLLLPSRAFAQEATLSGTVTDTTGGVLPGVTVTALHEATGNTFVAVTDDRGAFRLPVRTGVHRVTVELSGFTTVTRSIDLLVNQQAVVNLQLSPSAVQESVTVTGETPLIDTTSSQVGGDYQYQINVDGQQVSDLFAGSF